MGAAAAPLMGGPVRLFSRAFNCQVRRGKRWLNAKPAPLQTCRTDSIRVNAVLTHCADATLGNVAANLVSAYASYATDAALGILPGEG